MPANRKSGRSGPVAIHDLAAAARVSVSMVRKALNGSGKLRTEASDLVRMTAERLRFQPNESASRLTGQQHVTVGLISSDHHGRLSISVPEGIQDAVDAARIPVFLCSGAGDPDRERQRVQSLLAKRVAGFIVTGQRSSRTAAVARHSCRAGLLQGATGSAGRDIADAPPNGTLIPERVLRRFPDEAAPRLPRTGADERRARLPAATLCRQRGRMAACLVPIRHTLRPGMCGLCCRW